MNRNERSSKHLALSLMRKILLGEVVNHITAPAVSIRLYRMQIQLLKLPLVYGEGETCRRRYRCCRRDRSERE